MPEQIVGAVNPDGSLIGTGPISGTVSVSNFPATQPVSGTVTTVPSGTQNVNVTTPTSLATYDVASPSILNSFVYSQAEQTGVLAANTFLSVFNPVGSGKILAFGGAFISSYVVGDIAATVESMRGFRVTAASAGTLITNSTICQFDNTKPASIAEVRVNNPTVTLDDAIFNSPPFIGGAKGSIPIVHQVPVPPALGPFLFRPGEGIALRTNAGDVDTRWNLSVAWSEM